MRNSLNVTTFAKSSCVRLCHERKSVFLTSKSFFAPIKCFYVYLQRAYGTYSTAKCLLPRGEFLSVPASRCVEKIPLHTIISNKISSIILHKLQSLGIFLTNFCSRFLTVASSLACGEHDEWYLNKTPRFCIKEGRAYYFNFVWCSLHSSFVWVTETREEKNPSKKKANVRGRKT